MSAQPTEQKPATWGEALGGLFALGLLFLVGSCIFGGSDEKTARVARQVETPAASSGAQPVVATADATAPGAAAVSKAAGTVAFIIGLNGYDCMKVVDVHKATPILYDVTCVADHDGHEATYMVNAQTNDATPI